VTVYGAGFSATPANNTVKFNGVTASVSASDSGSIATTVPTGATTGPISVTVGASTVTSAQNFVVTIPGAPTITSFTPAYGASGTSVSVTGTNFNVSATTVKLNGITASSSVASTTSLSFTVPTAAGSGWITATTVDGTGTSAQDFIVPPSGVSGADIISVQHLAVGGGAANIAISTPLKHGMVLFDGNIDTYYTVQFGQFSTSPTSAVVNYKIIKPDNSVLATGTVGNASRPTIHLAKPPSTGTYSILLSPGNATLNTNVKVAADPTMTPDGSAAAVALDSIGQSARMVFAATASQRLSLGVGAFTLTPNSGSASTFKVYKPDATYLADGANCTSATTGNPQGNCDGEITATVAGTYTMVAEIVTTAAANFSAQLSTEITGTLTADTGVDLTLTRIGQDARYTFTANLGDSFGLDMAAIATQPQAQSVSATIYKPNGSTLTSLSAMQPSGGYRELGALATAGTYSVFIDPSYGAYGALHLTLKQGPLLITTDPATAFAPSAVTESARFRFSGTAGQNLSFGISDLAYVGSSSYDTYVYVYKPDGSQLASAPICRPTAAQGRCRVILANLPVTGTYSASAQGPAGVKITGNATLSADLTGTLVAGTPQTFTASRAGQLARLTFSGTAGDSTSVKLYGVSTTPSGQSVNLTIYKPDGSYLNQTSGSATTAGIVNFQSLPVTGTYTALVDPYYGLAWQGTVALDPGAAISIDGTTSTLATTAAGEPLRFRFTGTTGQRFEIGITGLTYGASSSATTSVLVYRPDGSQIVNISCSTSGAGACESWVTSLPSTGSYSVIVTPPGASSVTGGTLALSTPVPGTFVIGDPAQTVAISRPGQTARYTFSGTSGQLLRLNWTGATVSGGQSVAVSILKPDSSTLSASSFANGASGGFDIASLPTTGTYTVVFDPSFAATMSASISLVTR
jgi:trimeric autotransporter adhesin